MSHVACVKDAGHVTKRKRKARQKTTSRKTPKVRLRNVSELKELLNSVSCDEVLAYVKEKVPSQLVSHLFPERERFWKSLIADKLKTLVDSAVSKYLILYQECSKGADKNSELYLRWLQYQRTLVCKSLRSSESVVDMEMEEDTSEGTKRTVVTLIMSNVYAGISQQMAKEIEQSYSTNSVENADTSPSDDVALHRICGWVLKSVTDNVKQKSNKTIK